MQIIIKKFNEFLLVSLSFTAGSHLMCIHLLIQHNVLLFRKRVLFQQWKPPSSFSLLTLSTWDQSSFYYKSLPFYFHYVPFTYIRIFFTMPFCECLKHKTTSSDSTFTPFGSFHTEFSLDGVHYCVYMEISCGYFIMQTFYHCSSVYMWGWKFSRFLFCTGFSVPPNDDAMCWKCKST